MVTRKIVRRKTATRSRGTATRKPRTKEGDWGWPFGKKRYKRTKTKYKKGVEHHDTYYLVGSSANLLGMNRTFAKRQDAQKYLTQLRRQGKKGYRISKRESWGWTPKRGLFG